MMPKTFQLLSTAKAIIFSLSEKHDPSVCQNSIHIVAGLVSCFVGDANAETFYATLALQGFVAGLCVKAPLSQVEPRRNFEYCEFQEFTMKVGELLLILLWLLKVRYHLHHDISIRI